MKNASQKIAKILENDNEDNLLKSLASAQNQSSVVLSEDYELVTIIIDYHPSLEDLFIKLREYGVIEDYAFIDLGGSNDHYSIMINKALLIELDNRYNILKASFLKGIKISEFPTYAKTNNKANHRWFGVPIEGES